MTACDNSVTSFVPLFHSRATVAPQENVQTVGARVNDKIGQHPDNHTPEILTACERGSAWWRGYRRVRRTTNRLRAMTPEERASSLRRLSDQLAGEGRTDRALASLEEAVAVHRQLASVRPSSTTSYPAATA